MSTNADRVEFSLNLFQITGVLKKAAFAEQCDCMFDFNFLTIFQSM